MEIALIAAAAFAAAVISGLAGFAYALVGMATFLQFLPPLVAVPLILACSTAAQLFGIGSFRHAINWRRLMPFALAGLMGVPAGTYLLTVLSIDWFTISVGVFLVAYSLYGLTMGVLGRVPRVTGGGAGADGAIGFIGGVMGGAAGLSGAVPTVWCQMRGWPKDEARGVYQPYIVVLQIAALVSAWTAGAIDPAAYRAMLWALPATWVGVLIGLRLYRRVNDQQFRLIVQVLLLLSGLSLLITRALR